MISLTVQDCMDVQYYVLAVLFVIFFDICCTCLFLCAIGVLNGLNNIYIKLPGFTGINDTIGLCIRKGFDSYLVFYWNLF